MLILVTAQCFRSSEYGTKLWADANKMFISSQILQGCWIPKTSAVNAPIGNRIFLVNLTMQLFVFDCVSYLILVFWYYESLLNN